MGLRERLNETRQRQRTREEAEAWGRWAEQDRATWEREAKQEARGGATGRKEEGDETEQHGPGYGAAARGSAQGPRSDEGILVIGLVIASGIVIFIALYAILASNN